MSFISAEMVKGMGWRIYPNHQLALLADEQTRLKSLGEIDQMVACEVEKPGLGVTQLRLRALVLSHLSVGCYGDTTFHYDNGIVANISTGSISIHQGKFHIQQVNSPGGVSAPPLPSLSAQHLQERIQVTVPAGGETGATHASSKDQETQTQVVETQTISQVEPRVILPGDEYRLPVKLDPSISAAAILPQVAHLDMPGQEWKPQVCRVEGGEAVYINPSKKDILAHPKGVHFRAIPVTEMSLNQANAQTQLTPQIPKTDRQPNNLGEINLEGADLSKEQKERLETIHRKYYKVFDEDLSEGCKMEPVKISFNKEKPAPAHKLWAPQFNRKCQDLLQAKCDELERQNVLADPHKHKVTIKTVSPCFITQKGRAKHKKLEECLLEELRLITCYNALNDSIQPIPSKSNGRDEILKFLSRKRHVIHGDLKNSYFQIPVAKEQWGHLAVMTPPRGLRALTRTGQGLLNSDLHLDELMA